MGDYETCSKLDAGGKEALLKKLIFFFNHPSMDLSTCLAIMLSKTVDIVLSIAIG